MSIFGLFGRTGSSGPRAGRAVVVDTPPARAATKPYRRSFTKSPLVHSAPDFDRRGMYSPPIGRDILADRGRFLATYFRLLARVVPTVSDAIWVWQTLCSTQRTIKYEGGTESQHRDAAEIIRQLDARLSPFKYTQNAGLDLLIDLYFRSLFTIGRFAGAIAVSSDRIERFILVDPTLVDFDQSLQASVRGALFPVNEHTLYYTGLSQDVTNPYGTAMLEAATTLIEIADEMLTDMRYASSNAGIPRLHIKIDQPKIMQGEDQGLYATRCNSYFDQCLQEFSEIGPYDNFYSWSDVSISVVGGNQGPSGFVWKTNRQVVDEEIIGSFHLYPWAVAKSFSTTKNWVASQFDLLMNQADSVQKNASRFCEWLHNTELALAGLSNVHVSHTFARPRDPIARSMREAERVHVDTVIRKWKEGFITRDAAARELGYDKAASPVPDAAAEDR